MNMDDASGKRPMGPTMRPHASVKTLEPRKTVVTKYEISDVFDVGLIVCYTVL